MTQYSKVPWTAGDAWRGFVFLVAWLILFYLFITVLIVVFEIDPDFGLIINAGEVLLLVPVWFFTVRKYGAGWGELGFRKFKIEMLALAFGLFVLMIIFNGFFSVFLGLFDQGVQEDIGDLILEQPFSWAFVLGGIILAPVVEEVFFRGFIFTGLRQRYKWYIAASISSLLFALMHLQITGFIPLFFMGFLLAFLYHRSDSIWLPILCHCVMNAMAFGAIFLLEQ